jgi:hypothetical protein
MGIALLLPAPLASAARTLTHWLAPTHTPSTAANDRLLHMPQVQTAQVHVLPQPVRPRSGLPRQSRLLRGPVRSIQTQAPKVRVLDGNRPGGSGRLVIAGRMADVCAELDRLARAELQAK